MSELWIGAPAWPTEDAIDWLHRLEPWAGLGFTEFQIAGLLCHHQKFFGFQFEVPLDDRLAGLAHAYYASSLPGLATPEAATPLEEVTRLRDRLAELGLVLDPVYYAWFAEAYLPISVESAWAYAMQRELPMYEWPQGSRFDRVRRLEYIGLDSEWTTAAEYLRAFWLYFEQERRPGALLSGLPARWTAVMHVPNSD